MDRWVEKQLHEQQKILREIKRQELERLVRRVSRTLIDLQRRMDHDDMVLSELRELSSLIAEANREGAVLDDLRTWLRGPPGGPRVLAVRLEVDG